MKSRFFLTSALILGCVFTISAQPGFDPAVDDVTAPIPGIVVALCVALGLGARKLLKKK